MSLTLQCCLNCGAIQYPSRDVCRMCLSDALEWREMTVAGTVISEAEIHRSLAPELLAAGPIRIGAVATAPGVRIIALLAPGVAVGMSVELAASPSRPAAIVATASSSDGAGETPQADHS